MNCLIGLVYNRSMENVDWKSVGVLIKSLRTQRKLPHRELAARAAIDPGTLLRIEAGKPSRLSTIQKIEEAMNLSPGLLTHSSPLALGPFFLQEPSRELIMIRPNPNYKKAIPDYSQEMLQNPAERRRIGKLGIVSGFQWEPEIGLKGATMRGTLMEIYDETIASNHQGEEFVFGVQGSTVIKIANQEIIVHPNQIASFWPFELHSYAPHPSTTPPSLLLSVRIDTGASSVGEPKTTVTTGL
jgi:transcriptional regulator with XRE-family HTH domain